MFFTYYVSHTHIHLYIYIYITHTHIIYIYIYLTLSLTHTHNFRAGVLLNISIFIKCYVKDYNSKDGNLV